MRPQIALTNIRSTAVPDMYVIAASGGDFVAMPGLSAGLSLSYVVPNEPANSSRQTFTLPITPFGDAVLFLNGVAQAETGYYINSNTVVLSSAPLSGDVLWLLAGTPTNSALTINGTKTWIQWDALRTQPPSANFGTFDTVRDLGVIDFDGSNLDESFYLVGYVPQGASTAGGAFVKVVWSPDQGASGAARLRARVDKIADEVASWDDWTTVTTSTVSLSTAFVTTIIPISASELDGVGPGDFFVLEVGRNSSDTVGDTLAFDIQIAAVVMEGA